MSLHAEVHWKRCMAEVYTSTKIGKWLLHKEFMLKDIRTERAHSCFPVNYMIVRPSCCVHSKNVECNFNAQCYYIFM